MLKKIKTIYGFFTTYEKIWFLSITLLSISFAILFPEEEMLGINGKIIMILYLVDIFSNVACELLISKQSKWNFIVSLVVEITEITICIVLAYRFATMAVTLFFWIPIDIISFINWNKHKDSEFQELTVVRKLNIKQSILVIIGIIIWTICIGYILTTIEIEGILSEYPSIEIVCCYLDACVSAVGIANGIFILLRYREQWIAWYISSILETIINIISGQWILLILKVGYFTNTTYGYIKWTKYIKHHENSSVKM